MRLGTRVDILRSATGWEHTGANHSQSGIGDLHHHYTIKLVEEKLVSSCPVAWMGT